MTDVNPGATTGAKPANPSQPHADHPPGAEPVPGDPTRPPSTGAPARIFIPLVVALLAALGGAYAHYRLALWHAPDRTLAETRTLLGMAKETIELADAQALSPDLMDRLRRIERQTRAIEANLALWQGADRQVNLQADFWLWEQGAATLGGTTSFALNQARADGSLALTVNGAALTLSPGERIHFNDRDDLPCAVTYSGKPPGADLHGFQIVCGYYATIISGFR